MTNKKNYFLVGLVIFIFAVISFCSNILGPIISDIKKDLDLSATTEALLSAFFFIAYLFSIPMAILAEKIGQKKIILLSFIVAAIAALLIGYYAFTGVLMICFFAIGLGMATLQVVINPLLRAAGGEENFAFYSVVAQIVFGAAAYGAPPVQRWIGNNLAVLQDSVIGGIIHPDYKWAASYIMIFITITVIIFLISFLKLPEVELAEDEQTASKNTYLDLLKNPKVWIYFFAIFAYVGTEQGVTLRLKEFLMQNHQYSAINAEECISNFWAFLSVGCLIGLVLVKLFPGKSLLKSFVILAIISLSFGLFGNAIMSYYGFIAVGFFLSVMWSINISLGLNSIKAHQGALAGILCTGIIGGSICPLIIGKIIDLTGSIKTGMLLNYVTLGYILFVSFYAKPIVENKIVKIKDLFTKEGWV